MILLNFCILIKLNMKKDWLNHLNKWNLKTRYGNGKKKKKEFIRLECDNYM